MKRGCKTCLWRRARIAGECRACWQYRYRHGERRPEALIVAHAERIADRMRRGAA